MIRQKFYVPEIVLGIFLAVAVFGMGMMFGSSQQTPSHQQHQTENSAAKSQPPQQHGSPLWGHSDPGVTVATVLLFLVGIGQAIMFYVQLRYMRDGVKDAKIAADAAMLSAKAAIGIELPIIGIDAPDLQDIDGPLPAEKAYASGGIDQFPRRYSVIPSMYLRNGGRTPAFLVEFAIGHAVSADEPTELMCDGVYPLIAGEIVEAGSKEQTYIELHYQIELSDLALGAMKAKRKFLWLFVLVTYVDFLQEPHTATFIWRWNNPGGGVYLFERGGSPYTQWTPASQPNRGKA